MKGLLALCALLLMANCAFAQTPVMEDPASDTQSQVGGAVQSFPMAPGTLDLRGLSIQETDDAIQFWINVGALDNGVPGTTTADAAYYEVRFSHGSALYLAFVEIFIQAGRGAGASLWSVDGSTGSMASLGPLTATLSLPDLVSVEVPRALIPDQNNVPPVSGRAITEISVDANATFPDTFTTQSFWTDAGLPLTRVWDRMPDAGFGNFTLVHGPPQSDVAEIVAPITLRASNGEEGIFVYPLFVTNKAASAMAFALQATEVPPGWNAEFAQDILFLQAGETVQTGVVVTTPFAHQHGFTKALTIHLRQSDSDIDLAKLQVGLHYLDTPQPAGHHDRVYFHSRSDESPILLLVQALGLADAEQSFNTLAEDPADERIPAHPVTGSSANGTVHRWYLHLEPSLSMGLDFKSGQAGALQVPLSNNRPITDFTLRGRLLLLEASDELGNDRYPPFNGRNTTLLATVGPVSGLSLAPTGTLLVDAPIALADGVDVVPYMRGQGLVLILEMEETTVPIAHPTPMSAPAMEPGGFMDLPLEEYRDPLEGVFRNLGMLDFAHTTPAHATANPGRSAEYRFSLENRGPDPAVVALDILGGSATDSQLQGPSKVTIPAGQEVEVVLLVEVPTSARHGDRLDVILRARNDSGAGQTAALTQVVAEVVEDRDIPDAAPVEDSSKGVPMPSLLAILATMLAVAISRRR